METPLQQLAAALKHALQLLRARASAIRKGLGLALIAVTAWYVRKFLRFLSWRRKMMKMYPGPTPSLLLGDLPALAEAGGFNEEFFQNLHSKHGEFARFFFLPTMLNLSVTSPEHAVELYKKTRSRPYETETFLHYLGKDNLLFTHGPMVKQMRLRYGRMISNVEQLAKLNELSFSAMTAEVNRWAAEPAGVDLHKELGPLIYDVMGRTLFGGSWTNSEVGAKIYELHKYMIVNSNKWMLFLKMPGISLVPGYREYCRKMREWREVCGSLIDKRAEEIRRNPEKWAKDESALTLLVTSKDDEGKPFFSRSRAISTMCGFLNGAYDTTHATMYWLLFNLARFPEQQRKVRADIRKAIGTRTACSVEEARSMEYLDAFIRESMRFTTTVPVNQRVNYEEDITVGGHVIPKGVNCNVPNSILLYDKRYFGADSDEFRPSRFLAEDPICETARRAWVAFGGHSRMCIGFTFALVEMKAFLISVLQQYEVQLVDQGASDKKMIEAGVNQPEHKAQFRFVKPDADARQLVDNIQWWTPPREVRKKVNAAT